MNLIVLSHEIVEEQHTTESENGTVFYAPFSPPNSPVNKRFFIFLKIYLYENFP
jgi:hypothetical protein